VVQHVWAEQTGLAEKLKRGIEMVSFGSGGATRNWASRIADFELAGQSFHQSSVVMRKIRRVHFLPGQRLAISAPNSRKFHARLGLCPQSHMVRAGAMFYSFTLPAFWNESLQTRSEICRRSQRDRWWPGSEGWYSNGRYDHYSGGQKCHDTFRWRTAPHLRATARDTNTNCLRS